MVSKNSLCKFLYEFLLIWQLLSRDVEAYNPKNRTLIDKINSMNSSWKASANDIDIPRNFPKKIPSRKMSSPLIVYKQVKTPPRFDARDHWKRCKRVISRVRNQGACSSCWAVAAVSMLSDRTCIQCPGCKKVHLSAEDVITCCRTCMRQHNSTCEPAWAMDAIVYWITEGIVSGAEIGSGEGCKPYSVESSRGGHHGCERRCTNREYRKKYIRDKFYGKVGYQVVPNEDAIRTEIFLHGPVIAAIALYEDLGQYQEGVYTHMFGKFLGMHYLKMVGWGEENRMKYWLLSNTWGTKWGLRGFVKFQRGQNHCKVEENVIGGGLREITMFRERLVRGTGSASRGSASRTSYIFLDLLPFYLCFYFYF